MSDIRAAIPGPPGETRNEGTVPSEAVTAALAVLREHFDLGGSACVANYVWAGQTPDEREAGIRRLRHADEMEEVKVRIHVADALRAAMSYFDGGPDA